MFNHYTNETNKKLLWCQDKISGSSKIENIPNLLYFRYFSVSLDRCLRSFAQQEDRKEMCYLKPHSTYFICCYMLLYMVKDHSDNERGNPNFIGYSSKDIYMYHLTESVVYTMTFVTPDVEHWLE